MSRVTEMPTKWQIFKQIAPFVALGMVGLIASVLLPGPVDEGFGAAALLLSLLIIAAAVFTPWDRVPSWMQAVPILSYLLVVALLRQASGGGGSGLGALALMPVLWFALYGGRAQMTLTLICIGAVFLIPVAVLDPTLYPDQEWVKGVLWVVIAAAVGHTMQNLVIAQRRQAEELRASNELFEGTLRAATAYSIIATDANGLITVFNAGAERMLGYSADEMVGNETPLRIQDPAEVAERARELEVEPGFEALVARARRSDTETRQCTYRRKDGSPVSVELTVSATYDARKRIIGYIGIASDIGERLRAERALQDSHDALVEVTRLSKEISKAPDARVAICTAAREVCGADLAVLMEATGNRQLTMTASTGIELPAITVDLDAESSGNGIAFESGKRLFIPDATDHPAISNRVNDVLGIRSCLFEPVMRGGEIVGILTIGWRERLPELSARSDLAATMLARDAGMKIESADLLSRLEGAALTDQLTGLPNRRAWDEALPKALDECAMRDEPAAVAMFDIDRFKHFNDAHGHQAGDRLLIEAGAAWREQTREGDLLARYGGEEFVLLMRNCRPEDARDVVERIRRAAPGSITCSAGFSSWRPGEGAEALVARADAALYEAKGRGRDQAIAYSSTTSEKPGVNA
jgi:diguanylate cyclase (GGDEF)-like protein/PAS domain S-box-containing protein